MISACLITPNFLYKVCDNHFLFQKFYENFYIENKKIAKEVIFLIDDKKSTYKKEYIKILEKLSGKNPRLEVLIKDFLLKLNSEILDLSKNKKKIDIILDDINDIQKSIKLEIPYIQFPISRNKLDENIKSLVRYANKITLFDPYILDHITNFSKKGIAFINKNLENIENNLPYKLFKAQIIDIDLNYNSNYQSCYKTTIRNLIEIFHTENNKNLNIEILTCIKNDTQKKFNDLIDQINRKYLEENDNSKKEKIKHLLESIKKEFFSDTDQEGILVKNYLKILSRCFSDTKWLNKNINLRIVNDWNDQNDQFYQRGMLVEGNQIRTVICIKKAINFFEVHRNKSTRLKNEGNYRFKLIENPNEKKIYTIQTRFPNFKQKVRNFHIN